MHETVSDGSVYFGHDSQTPGTDGSPPTNDFNTDETVKFPSAVALVWRWTGDNRFRDEMYDFARRNMRVVDQRLDVDRDGWPEGSGNVERPGMGPEKLDNGVYYMRGLYDLADMAVSKHDMATARWATGLADRLRRQFEATWWDPGSQSIRRIPAGSRERPGVPEALDRSGADGSGAQPRHDGSTRRGHTAARYDRAGGPRSAVLQRRASRQPWPVPHGLRRRVGRQG